MATIILSIMKLHLPVHLFRAVMLLLMVSADTLCASEPETELPYDFVITAPYDDFSSYGDNQGIFGYDNVIVKNIDAEDGGVLNTGGGSQVLIKDNQTVTISGNSGRFCVVSTYGSGEWMLENDPAISISSNGAVRIENNYTRESAGAISAVQGSGMVNLNHVELNNNVDVDFIGNTVDGVGVDDYGWYAPRAGAIDASTLQIMNNSGRVHFIGNRVQDDYNSDYSWRWPSTSGAITCLFGELKIENNGNVLFEKNVCVAHGEYFLRSVYVSDSNGPSSLSSAAGNLIEFRDSAIFQEDLNINKDFGESAQRGDVLFTGAYTEKHLNEILAADGVARTATPEEILKSRTTEVNAMTNLYGGRLRVEDGAIYQGQGITVHENSMACVLVKDAALNHPGYDLTFNSGTTLALAGDSTITGNVQMLEGSTLRFDGSETKGVTGLDGELSFTGGINIVLDNDIAWNGQNEVLLFVGGSISGWDENNLAICNGESNSADIRWINGDLLVLNYNNETFIPYFRGGLEFTNRHSGDLKLKYYNSVSFDSCWAPPSYSSPVYECMVSGGAVSGGDINLTDNEKVRFSSNEASLNYIIPISLEVEEALYASQRYATNLNARGGAVSGDEVAFSANESVEFEDNSANIAFSDYYGATGEVFGGAIDGAVVSLCHNKSILFSGNSVFASFESSNSYPSYFSVKGGAIYGNSVELNNNGDVTFTGNSAYINASSTRSSGSAFGGAIYVTNDLSIQNNDFVLFSGNTESDSSGDRMRCIYVEGGTVLLSAAAGNRIEFRDSVYIGSASTVKLNDEYSYQDADGRTVTVKQQGDILFIGANCPTEVYTMTNLYGGRLRVEDGTVYQGYGITAHAGSESTVRVKDSWLEHAGCDLIFNAGTTLELAGQNIVHGDVQMEAGSTLSFHYDSNQRSQAAMTLTGNLTLEGTYHILVNGYEGQIGAYKLITIDEGEVTGWDYRSLCLNSRSREIISPEDYLRWVDNSLYYSESSRWSSTVWTNAAGNGQWDNRSFNWAFDDGLGTLHSNTALMNVKFSANEGESVKLVGSLLVDSMTVEQGGRYTYTAGNASTRLRVVEDLRVEAGASADIQLGDGVRVDGELLSSGELKVSKVTGEGSMYIDGGILELADDTDALAVEGSVYIDGAELRGNWTGTGLSIGTSSVAAGAEVTLHDVEITSELVNDGSLNLGGQVTVQADGLSAKSIGTKFSAGESGYRYEENTYTLVTGDGSTSALAGTQWTVQGGDEISENATYSYINGVLQVTGPQDMAQYWVNGAVTYDGRSEFAPASTLVLNGGNLTLNANLGGNLTGGIRVDAAGTLTLGAGVQVDRTAVTGHHNNRKVTLQGSGRLNLNGSASFAGYELGDEWMGTVAISDDTSSNSTNMALDSIGQAGSTIELKNVKGHTGVNGGTVAADLVLVSSSVAGTEQAAFRVSDGYSNASDEDYVMTTFSGKVSGEGKMVYAASLYNEYTGFAFSGDVSGWNGAFEMNGAKTFNLVFSGAATEIKADICDVSSNGTLNLWLGADAAMQVKGTVDTDSITVTNDKAVSFGGVVSTGSLLASESQVGFASSATISGNMEVAELVLNDGATVDVGGCLTTGSIVLEGLQQEAPALTVGSFGAETVLFTLNGDALSALNLGHGESVTIASSEAALANGFKALMANGTEKMTVTVYDYLISRNANNVVVTADYANWGTRVWYEGAWVGDKSWSDMLIGGYSVTDGVERVDLQGDVLETENLFIAPGSSCSSVVITNGEIYADYAELADASLTIGTGATMSVYEFLAEEKEVLLQGTLDVSNASIGSLSGTTGSLSIQTDGEVTVGSNVTLGSFSSDGVLDIGSHTLNVAGGVSRAGSVIAGEVKVHNSGRNAVQFDTLIADKVTVTNRLASSSYTDDISVGDGSAIGELVAETLELRDGSMQLGRDDKATEQSLQKLKLATGSSMELNENTALTVTGTLDAGVNTTVSMKQGASLSYGDVSISNKRSDATASVTARELADGTGAVVTNAHASFAATAEKSVDYQFVNSSVENAGSALLTLTNSGSTLTGLHATGGNVDVLALGDVTLNQLEISTGKTIAAAAVTVTELAKLADGAKLAGNLTLASGATVELGGTLTLEGALNLQTGLTLSGTMLETIAGLEEGQSHILFSGVTELNVQESMTLSNMRSIAAQTQETASYRGLMDGQQVAAGDYFCNLAGNSGLVLSYNSEAGTVSISHTQAIPEPTTATLSLLALAGLCARRRRK